MKVVAVDLTPLGTSSRFRGIGTYALDLGRAIARTVQRRPPEDLDVRFLVGFRGRYDLWPVDKLWPVERWSASSARELETVLSSCGGRATTSYQRYYMEKRLAQRRFLDGRGVDLLHATDPKGTAAWGRYRTVVTAHDLIPTVMGWPYRWFPGLVSRGLDWVRYAPHDHLIAISSWTSQDLRRLLRVPAERITVVHHGVDHAVFTPDRSPPNGSYPSGFHPSQCSGRAGRPYFFYVGGFDPRKQVPGLVRAFGAIAREVDADLLIVGSPTSGPRRVLDAAIRESGSEGRVRVLGFVSKEELAGLYRGAIAHVLPSLYEGFGMTAAEAMACGCPVVTLRATSVPEVCGDAAEYAGAGDWGAFSRAMVRIASDDSRRAELRKRGIERAAALTWERAAEQTLEVYRKVVTS